MGKPPQHSTTQHTYHTPHYRYSGTAHGPPFPTNHHLHHAADRLSHDRTGAPEAEAPPAEAPPADEGKKGKKAKKGKKVRQRPARGGARPAAAAAVESNNCSITSRFASALGRSRLAPAPAGPERA